MTDRPEGAPPMTLGQLSKDERSLLLFFETAAVDHAGALDMQHMNDDDRAIAARWNEEGFIQYGRIAMASLRAATTYRGQSRTHWVELSPEALALAQEERRARITRLAKTRTWKKTREREVAND